MLKSKDLLLIHMNENPKFEDIMRSFCMQKWSKTLKILYSLIIHTRWERLQNTRVTAWLSICGPSFAERVSVNVYTLHLVNLLLGFLCLINLFPLDFCGCSFFFFFFHYFMDIFTSKFFFTFNFIYLHQLNNT